MPLFTQPGSTPNDLWLADGSPDFAVFPGGLIDQVPQDVPIWLKVGTPAYGVAHIAQRHAAWIRKQGKPVYELVWDKLGQPGKVLTTEAARKVKINLHLNPSALLILQLEDRSKTVHFSVTSLYLKQGKLDGDELGKYPGRPKPRLLVGQAYLDSLSVSSEAKPKLPFV